MRMSLMHLRLGCLVHEQGLPNLLHEEEGTEGR